MMGSSPVRRWGPAGGVFVTLALLLLACGGRPGVRNYYTLTYPAPERRAHVMQNFPIIRKLLRRRPRRCPHGGCKPRPWCCR